MDIFSEIKKTVQFDICGISISRLMTSVAIFIIFLVLKRLFSKSIIFLLGKLQNRTRISSDSRLVRSIESSSQIIFVVAGIYIAFSIIPLSAGSRIIFNRVIRSCISFIIFWVLYQASGYISQYLFLFSHRNESKFDNTLSIFLNNALKLVVCIFGATAILQQWGYDFATLLTGLGIGGLAFALAAKDTIANLFGSVMIMLDKPFAVGDWIITSKSEGRVEAIGFRSTRLRTSEQAIVTIPNSIISNEFVTNMSRTEKRRISFRLQIPASTSTFHVRAYINGIYSILNSHSEVDHDTIMVIFERFAGNKLEIYVNFLVRTIDWQKTLEIQNELNMEIKSLMDKLNLNT